MCMLSPSACFLHLKKANKYHITTQDSIATMGCLEWVLPRDDNNTILAMHTATASMWLSTELFVNTVKMCYHVLN